MKSLLLALSLLLVFAPAQADEIDDYIELLRQDARTMTKMVVRETMALEGEEADRFWKVYDKYALEIEKMNNTRLELIRDFAESYFELTDAHAQKLANQVLNLRIKRDHVRKDYYKKFSHAVGPKKAARFIQLDLVISQIIDLQISSELPLIE